MKKIIVLCVSIFACLSLLVGTVSAGEIDNSVVTGDKLIDMMKYYNPFADTTTVDEVLERATFITKTYLTLLGDVINKDSLKEFKSVVSALKKNPNEENAQAVLTAFNELEQDYVFSDRVIFLWGDKNMNMPYADGEDGEAIVTGAFLLEFLADNPQEAKGNILLCSGGPGTTACVSEGHPSAKAFSKMGYNCFVFNVRSETVSEADSIMDVQRAIKMVRYLVDMNGYGGADLIVGNGYSAGNIRLMNVLLNVGNEDNASKYDSDYVADEIDTYKSDMDVYINIYGGAFEPFPTDVSHMPAVYFCAGDEDDTGALENYMNNMDEQLKTIGIPLKVNVVTGAKHGFGPGIDSDKYPSDTESWTIDAGVFMQENRGFSAQY